MDIFSTQNKRILVILGAIGAVALAFGLLQHAARPGSNAAQLARQSSGPEPAPQASGLTDRPVINVESVVSFPKGMFACLSKKSASDALDELVNHEQTRFLGHFAGVSRDGDCAWLDPSSKYTVIGVHPAWGRTGGTLVEIVGQGHAAGRGAFALIPDQSFVHRED